MDGRCVDDGLDGGWMEGWMCVGRAMLANASNLTNRRHRLFEASQFHTLHR